MIRTKKDLEKIRASHVSLMKMREGKKRFRIVVSLGEENMPAKETLNEFIKVLDELKIYDCAVFFGPKSSISEAPVVEIHGKTLQQHINVTAAINCRARGKVLYTAYRRKNKY